MDFYEIQKAPNLIYSSFTEILALADLNLRFLSYHLTVFVV